MKKGVIAGIIIGIGLLVLLKVFQSSVPRISDPLTNIIVFTGFALCLIIYGISRLRREKK